MGHSTNFETTGTANKFAAGHKNKKLFDKPTKFRSRRKEIVYQTNFKIKKHFTGASPPEIFVGRYGYPHVNAGILSPDFHEDTEDLSMPEVWHEKGFGIGDILTRRSKLIYGRFKTGIKRSVIKNRFKELMQEIAMAYKPVSTEVFLKKDPRQHLEVNKYSAIITNYAPLENARLQENAKVEKKVDYLVSDTHVKSTVAVNELHASGIPTSNIQKILSAGLLGVKINRRLVPTRWSITSVDSTISKSLMSRIRYYPLISDYMVFSGNYLGNYYEILLVPRFWSFEVIEADIKMNRVNFWQDYEGFHDRKKYADEVTGGYYSARLPVAEYLTQIKRQASVLVLRETNSEYYAHLGVGILRECCRGAFKNKPRKFLSLKEALNDIQTRLNLKVEAFTERSKLMGELGQTTLDQFA